MKKILCLALALVMLLALCACGSKGTAPASATDTKKDEPAKKAETIEMSCAVALPEGELMVEVMKKMGEDLYARTDGRYSIKVYPNATLCSQAELFGMLKSGGVTMGEAPIEAQAEADTRFAALQLPFAFDSLEANYKFNLLANERLNNKLIKEKFNAFPLFSVSSGVMQYIGTKNRVEKVDDLKGQLIWVANSLAASTTTALGASPVTLEWPDGYPALQKHTVDGAFAASLLGPYNFHWEDALTTITLCNISGSSSNMYMSLDVFNAMPEADQKVLLELAQGAEKELMDYYIDMTAKLPDLLRERGIDVYELSADELANWRAAASSVYDEYYAKLDPADAEIIRKCIEEANAG